MKFVIFELYFEKKAVIDLLRLAFSAEAWLSLNEMIGFPFINAASYFLLEIF